MFVVAVTKWGVPLDGELQPLAAHLGVVAYDLRMKLAGALPTYFATTPDEATASQHADFLRGRGHGVVVCDVAAVPGAETMPTPREFSFTDSGVSASDANGRPMEMPFAEILSLIRAVSLTDEDRTVITTEKKFSMGRAVISGGLMMSKKVEKHSQSSSQHREHVLYMFHRMSAVPWVWRELSLRYTGLGEAVKTSSIHNFAAVAGALRERAAHALYDEGLVTQKRRGDAAIRVATQGERRIEASNDRENELAAYLMTRALVEHQR